MGVASLATDTLWYSDKHYRIIGKVTITGLQTDFFDSGDYGLRDIAWDGTYIWAISSDGTVKKYDPSGEEIDTYPKLLTEGWGLTFDGTYIWASDPSTDRIYQLSFPGMCDFDPPSAPILSSDTHPSENVWFSHNSPTFNWTKPTDLSGISGYSYRLDHHPQTRPDTVNEGIPTSVTFSNVADGTWYFHCRARDGAGNWGPPNHYRIKIDTKAPPAPIDVTGIPGEWTNVNLFQVVWSYPEDSSSIIGSYYKIGSFPLHETDGTFIQASQLFFSVPDEGEHPIYVWLEDGAGNKDHTAHGTTRLSYDATSPSHGSISINEGAKSTSSVIVTLDNLGATDLLSGMGSGAQMRFSNKGSIWSPAEGYKHSKTNRDLSLYGGTGAFGQKTAFVKYRDAAGNWSVSFSDTILFVTPLMVTTDSLPGGIVGFAFQETLTATGGVPPYSWDLSYGVLPSNLTLHPDGRINGIPEEPGTSVFVIRVTDSFSTAGLRAFSITVYAGTRKGDVDNDGELDLFDALLIVRYLLGREHFSCSQLWAADVVSDGVINVADVVTLANLIVGRSPGTSRTSLPDVDFSILQTTPKLK